MEAYAFNTKARNFKTVNDNQNVSSRGSINKFCDFCSGIPRFLGSELLEAVNVPHHNTYPAFLESAEGCPLCSLIIQSLREYRDGIVRIQCSCSRELRIQVTYFREWQSTFFDTPLEDNFYFELFQDRGRTIDADDEVFGRPILDDPAEAVVSVALPWISDCQRNHARCRQVEDGNFPTRLLDVGKDGDDVLLRESKDLSENYTVLSHCWGRERTLTTTVGVRYLWIDSLCIIQDQLSDWEHESAKMHKYYKNSFVTIAALDSKNSFAGMLHQRQVPFVQIPGSENLFLRSEIPMARRIYEYSTLESRAWCLQERLLSTRVIHMTKSELLFECRTNHRRESSVQIGDSMAREYSYYFCPDRLKRALDDLELDPRCSKNAPQFWYNLVQQYSRRNLTNPTDMLPAILGVAKQIEKYTGLTYVSGLWKEDLPRGLLWANDLKRNFGSQRMRGTGAPSWSWASMTGETYWPRVQRPAHDVIGWASKIIGIPDVELVLHCRCVRVSLKQSPPKLPSTYMFSGQYNNNGLDHGWDLKTTAEVYLWSEQDGHGDRIGWMMADDGHADPSSHPFCMALEVIRTHQRYPS
ncbi:hypothetical protein IFR05_010737 [Cadophora sp. M221]|nr:hypothetical protein IFR05_010737 [Cadophora sp. M221]